MILTKFAVEKINDMGKKESPNIGGLRIAIKGGGCSGFTYDMDFEENEQPGDHINEHYGLKIYIDPMSWHYLDGTEIDYVESFQLTGFQFNNPNANNTCGCGSSFSI